MMSPLRERPLLFVVLAAFLIASVVIGTFRLFGEPSVEARLRAAIIEIDGDADDPDALVRPVPLGPERLRAALLQASEEIKGGPSGGSWRHDLWVERSIGGDAFVVGLHGSDTDQLRSRLDGLITSFADQANDRRAQQKIQAMAWTLRREAALRTRIDDAKAAIVDNPFNPDVAGADRPTRSGKLLRLMIDATAEVRTASRAEDRASGASARGADDDSDLAATVARLSDALEHLEAGQAAQLEYGTALKEAETALADLRTKAGPLTGDGGILARPAVTVLEPASASLPVAGFYAGLGMWPLLCGLIVMSLGAAFVATALVCRLKPSAEIAAGAYLDDPNWPLPQGARRELSV